MTSRSRGCCSNSHWGSQGRRVSVVAGKCPEGERVDPMHLVQGYREAASRERPSLPVLREGMTGQGGD